MAASLEQLRQRVTVRYHLRALDLEETSAYINHRLKKAAIGAPMEFSAPVTELIGRASQGLPRRINIIADAALLFGYGENQRVIDVPLVQEVLAELQGTGVLPLSADAAVEPEYAAAGVAAVAAEPAPARTVAPDTAAAARAMAVLQAREQDLAEREARITVREGELAEQHRILMEQYRLLKSYAAQTSAAQTTASAAAAAPWPPPAATPAAVPRAAVTPVGPQFAMTRREGSATVWTRMWRGLLDLKPLED